MIKTIILVFIIFFLSLLNINEYFVSNYTKIMNYDLNKLEFPTYNQNYEFVPKNEYIYIKDSKFINQYHNPIPLDEHEYKNLKFRFDLNDSNSNNNNNNSNSNNNNNNNNSNNGYIINDLPSYPLVKKELSLTEFKNVLESLKLKFKNPYLNLKLVESNVNKNLNQYYLIKEWIVEQLSIEADKDIYKLELVNNERYRYKQDVLLKHAENNRYENFAFKMRVYRDNKFSHFILYIDILFDKQEFKYYINDLIVLGSEIEENIDFGTYKQNLYPENNTLESEQYSINEFLKSKENKKTAMDTHYCFFKQAKNKLECKSPRKRDYTVGIWDSKCLNNEDCPFYKKNNNYPNTRGGCKAGYCEMPVNVKPVGFKQYLPDTKPMCYNCKKTNNCIGIECNKCCDEQKDKEKYPDLNGPDYVFSNDFNQRIKYSKAFTDKNLSPIKLIT